MATLRLLAQLGLDKTGFDAGITKATKEIDKFGAGLKRQLAGAFAAASVVAFTKSIIEMGSSIKDTSDRLGITAEDVQALSLAAKLGGTDLNVFATALERMRRSAAEGKGLEAFGISKQMMLDEDPAKVFRAIGQNIQAQGLNATRTKALFDVFGRGVGQLVPAMMELQNVDKQSLLSGAEVEKIDKLGDRWEKFIRKTKTIGAKIILGPEMPWEKTNAPAAPKPRISEWAEILAEEERKRAEYISQQDEIIRIEKETQERLRAQHMREQDALLRQEKLSKLSPFELELRKNTEAMQNIERALTERGIVVRDIVQ